MSHFDLESLIRKFEIFTKPYLKNSDEIMSKNFELKFKHTLAVLENCIQLLESTDLNKNIQHSALASCLLHDIGRFPQYAKYKTFKDAESINHARLSVSVIVKLNFLKDISARMRRDIIGAVSLHNRRSLPLKIREPLLTILKITRDCDKIDIMGILLNSIAHPELDNDVALMGLKEKPYMISDNILKSVQSKECAYYLDMKCINDFRLMLLSWTYDLNFQWTRQEVIKRNYINIIFKDLPDTPQLKALRPEIEDILNFQSDTCLS